MSRKKVVKMENALIVANPVDYTAIAKKSGYIVPDTIKSEKLQDVAYKLYGAMNSVSEEAFYAGRVIAESLAKIAEENTYKEDGFKSLPAYVEALNIKTRDGRTFSPQAVSQYVTAGKYYNDPAIPDVIKTMPYTLLGQMGAAYNNEGAKAKLIGDADTVATKTQAEIKKYMAELRRDYIDKDKKPEVVTLYQLVFEDGVIYDDEPKTIDDIVNMFKNMRKEATKELPFEYHHMVANKLHGHVFVLFNKSGMSVMHTREYNPIPEAKTITLERARQIKTLLQLAPDLISDADKNALEVYEMEHGPVTDKFRDKPKTM